MLDKKTVVIYQPIGAVMPYENNPRKNDKAIDSVAASIQDFGFKVPIIVDSDNVIIAGHTRLEAAKKLGLDEVPVVVASDLTPERIKAFRLADNKVAEIASWDEETLAAELEALQQLGVNMYDYGFVKADFAELGEVEEMEADDVGSDTDVPTKTRSEAGDIWQLGEHRLLVGDATNKTNIQQLLDGEKLDLLMTDPPYGVSYQGGTEDEMTIENDDLQGEQLQEFLYNAFSAADSVMRPGAAFYIWHASSTVDAFLLSAKDAGWLVKQHLMWVKSSIVLGRQDYQWQHEPCLYGWKPGTHYFTFDRTSTTVFDDERKPLDKMNKTQLKNLVLQMQNEQAAGDIIREDKPARNGDHPTMKPVKLIARLVANSTRRGDRVGDLFAGSGSTLLACEQLGRICYAAELDPKYADVIIKRWEELTGGTARKVTS